MKNKLKYEDRQFSDEKLSKLEQMLKKSVVSSVLGGILGIVLILFRSQISPLIGIPLTGLCLISLILALYFLLKTRKEFYKGENK